MHDTDEGESRLCNFFKLHAQVLNSMLLGRPDLLTGSLSALVNRPLCRVFVDFDVKRAYFRRRLKDMRKDASDTPIKLHVSRGAIISDSFNQIAMLSDSNMLRPLSITFDGEDGVDAGGA